MSDPFTPGPWKSIPSPHGRKYRCVQIGSDESYTMLEMLPGDANLIAAAPRMFELLETISNNAWSVPKNTGRKIDDLINEIIAGSKP